MEVTNIGKNQRITRSVLGVLLLLITFYLAWSYIDKFTTLWYIGLFLLIYNGVFLFLEGKEGVCPVNAMREKKSMTGVLSFGKQDIENADMAEKLKDKTMMIGARALIITIMAMIPFLLI